MAAKVVITLPDQEEYAVRIGSGVIGALGRNLRTLQKLAHVNRLLIITDSNVAPLYLATVKRVLTEAEYKVSDISVPAGEGSKSLEIVGEVWSAMAQLGLGRDCAVVALGGGVVGDLAGWAAASYMRGVPVIQVPTTLLAMVDSSVGGKTAINLPEGKNMVGAFWQPTYVCADTDMLATLSDREWRCGCGEIAKSAVIDSDDFFFWLLENAPLLAARDTEVTTEAIARCVAFKADTVARDVHETIGVRECLNYGHTLGHAIEVCTGYGALSHGEAVGLGMRFACVLADDLGYDVGAFSETQGELLDALGLAQLDLEVPDDELVAAMKHDKKVRDGALRFVLVRDVGRWRVEDVDEARVRAALATWRAQMK